MAFESVKYFIKIFSISVIYDKNASWLNMGQTFNWVLEKLVAVDRKYFCAKYWEIIL